MKGNVKRGIKITFSILFITILLSYVIYAIVIWNISKSPDDFSAFPKSGVWVCENEKFSLTIDLNKEENELTNNALNAKSITISFNEKSFNLDCYTMHGHGTPFAPVQPATILKFETIKNLNDGEENQNFVHFSVNKFKFNEDDFYLLNINLCKNNNVQFLTENMDLHFIKKL